jgi:hypothetical protein
MNEKALPGCADTEVVPAEKGEFVHLPNFEAGVDAIADIGIISEIRAISQEKTGYLKHSERNHCLENFVVVGSGCVKRLHRAGFERKSVLGGTCYHIVK